MFPTRGYILDFRRVKLCTGGLLQSGSPCFPSLPSPPPLYPPPSDANTVTYIYSTAFFTPPPPRPKSSKHRNSADSQDKSDSHAPLNLCNFLQVCFAEERGINNPFCWITCGLAMCWSSNTVRNAFLLKVAACACLLYSIGTTSNKDDVI